MWPRVVELMLGVWLLLSPFIFGYDEGDTMLWISDYVSATLLITFALLSYWHPTRHAHLLSLLVAVWLIAFGRFGALTPLPPGMQGAIVIGLLVLMLAIIPNDASHPPSVRLAAGD